MCGKHKLDLVNVFLFLEGGSSGGMVDMGVMRTGCDWSELCETPK